MKIRADVAELLRDGHSNQAIARRLHLSERTVATAREALRLPKSRRGRKPQQSLEQALFDRSRPIDGGHRQWTGPVHRGNQYLKYDRQRYMAGRAAFLVRYGREPVGNVTPGCGMPGCVAPDHVEDKPMRNHTNSTFTAIFGGLA